MTASPAAYANDDAARELLLALFHAAVAAADPAVHIASYLANLPQGRCIVVGAGKASAAMAAAVEQAWPDVPLTGCVVVPYGSGVPCQRIKVMEAAHPVPDENSVRAARHILDLVADLSTDDLVLALISGGGSATLCLPAPGITLEEKQLTNRLLLSSGLDIRTMNAVRRRLSAIKGGKLALAAHPARVVTLAISDIPGDDAAAIASGPTARPPADDRDWGEVVASLGPDLPASVRNLLLAPVEPPVTMENPEPVLIATPAASLRAAARLAREQGVTPIILGDDIEGESADVARGMARALPVVTSPTVFISGGETTVTIQKRSDGRGGRNTEFALALACELEGNPEVWALSADTDGEDGASLGAAGAIVTPDTLSRAKDAGLDIADHLDRHDSGSLFQAIGDLVVTGPTRTNVNDFRAILVLPRGSQHQLAGE